nr:hypothetical protein [Methanosarcina horonobensis]
MSSSGRIDNNTILNCDRGIILGEDCNVDDIINNTVMSCAECGIFAQENNGVKRDLQQLF